MDEISYDEWLKEWEDLYFDCPRAAFKCLIEDLWVSQQRVRELTEILSRQKSDSDEIVP